MKRKKEGVQFELSIDEYKLKYEELSNGEKVLLFICVICYKFTGIWCRKRTAR